MTRLTGFGDELLGSVYHEGAESGYVYDSHGVLLTGPVPMRGVPQALGADGTVYNTECDALDVDSANMALIAYSWELEQLWTLEFGPGCSYSSVSLAEDGILYVTRELLHGVEVIAVQTASPGLARTANPIRKMNNRRTG